MRGWVALLGVVGLVVLAFDLPVRLAERSAATVTPDELANRGWPEGFVRVRVTTLGPLESVGSRRKVSLTWRAIDEKSLEFGLGCCPEDPVPLLPAVVEGRLELLSERRREALGGGPRRLLLAGDPPGLLPWVVLLLVFGSWIAWWGLTRRNAAFPPPRSDSRPIAKLTPELSDPAVAVLLTLTACLPVALPLIGRASPLESAPFLLVYVGVGVLVAYTSTLTDRSWIDGDGVVGRDRWSARPWRVPWSDVSLRVDPLTAGVGRLVLVARHEGRISKLELGAAGPPSLEFVRRLTHELARHRLPELRARLDAGETLRFGSISLSRSTLVQSRRGRAPREFAISAIRSLSRRPGKVVAHLRDGTEHELPAREIHDAWALPYLFDSPYRNTTNAAVTIAT